MTETAITNLLPQREQFLRFLERRVESRTAAEDILQTAYLRALKHASELRSETSSVAWFYRILRNAVIDHYRHRTAEDNAHQQWAADLATETQPDADLEKTVCACIEDALPTLKPAYQQVIRAIDLDETSLAHFASAAGITAANAAVRVHRARQALKRKLIQICGTCSTHGCLNCTCC